MSKFLAGLGAVMLGFGLYNLLFSNGNQHISSDWLIPIINLRYSFFTTEPASYVIITVGFVIMVLAVIVGMKNKNR